MSKPPDQMYAERQHSFDSKQWIEMYSNRDPSRKASLGVEDALNSDSDESEGKEYSKWSQLPDLLLENIFSYLSMREKYYASMVCKSWNRAFYLPYVWSHFVLADTSLTRRRFNYYSGWQYILDHLRTQLCLTQVGKNFRHLTFAPMLNFYNLYEFMNMLSWYREHFQLEQIESAVGSNIESLKFTFLCNMSNREGTERIRLFGTGGKLLDSLKRLIGNLEKLKRLELVDLMLDPQEAQFLLDDVCEKRFLTLKTLILINATRVPYQMLHAGVFLNLQVLVIGPQNLGNELIELIGFIRLRHLHILQNRYSPTDPTIVSVSAHAWKLCRKNNRELRVHLQMETIKEKPLIWQEGAPVRSILYDSPHMGLQTEPLMHAIDMYGKGLRVYGYQNIPRFHRSKSFDERIDGLLMLLCRHCVDLRVLVITERISTATILLLAHTATKLQQLHIRRNAIVKRCDWPHSPEWSPEFCKWLKYNSQSYDAVEREVSQMLGQTWRMLNDKDFKRLRINLHDEALWM